MFKDNDIGAADSKLDSSNYQKSSTIVGYGWRTFFVRYGLYAIALFSLVMMGLLAKGAFETYGIVEYGKLAPLWQRLSLALGIMVVPILVIWGLVAYLRYYVVRLMIYSDPKKGGFPNRIVLIQTMTATGFKEVFIDQKDLVNLTFNNNYNNSYYLFNIKETYRTYIIDGHGVVDHERLHKLFL